MSSTDYLDKIAPQAPKRKIFELNLRNIIILAVAAIALVIVAVIIANSIGGRSIAPWQHLSIRLTNTDLIATDAAKAIKNSQLRSLNSEVKLTITNTQRDLTAPLASVGVVPKKIPVAVTQIEKAAHTEMTTRLETARLNAKYDSAYAREMSYQLSTILALYQELYAKSGPASKKILETAYNNLKPTQEAIAGFSDSNE